MLHCVPVTVLLKEPKHNNLHSSTTLAISCKKEKLKNSLTENTSQLKDVITGSANNEKYSLSSVDVIEDTELKKYFANESNRPESQKSDCIYHVVNETVKIEEPLKEIQQTLHTPTQPSSRIGENTIDKEKLNNNSNYDQNEDHQSPPIEKQNKYVEAFKTLIVFKDLSFLIIVLCHSLYGYVGLFLYTIVIEISRDKGFPQSREHFFLMFFPIAEFFGHTCFGWVTDKGYLNVSNYTSICSLCMGTAAVTFVLSNNYFLIMIATMCFGLSFATIYSACPSLVYEFIEEKHHTMAIASRLIFYTPLVFTMAPLIDYFRGTLGSYDGVIYLLTGICLGCSALLLLLPSISKCSNRKK